MKRPYFILSLILNFLILLIYYCGDDKIQDTNPPDNIISTTSKSTTSMTTTSDEFCGYIPTGNLTEMSLNALKRVPLWLKADLNKKLVLLEPDVQNDISTLITECTNSKYIDEIAFIIANTEVEILTYENFYKKIIYENVDRIYQYSDPNNPDAFSYVKSVETGIPLSDCEYSTTLKYKVYRDGNVEWIETPKEIYYWYVVHPVIEDEKPLYISPDFGWEEKPENGFFWRSYLYDIQELICPYDDTNPDDDNLCPKLIDRLKITDYAWNFQKNDNNPTNAIGALTQWIQDVMKSGISHFSKPIQPVRIYYLHYGQSVEFSYITTAAARTSLIPSVNVTAYLWDHTWNEFWLDNWYQWEPVNTWVDNPDAYSWDMRGASITRGDGMFIDVTKRYTSVYCSLTVNVKDKSYHPVEGADILLFSDHGYGTSGEYYLFFEGITDDNGSVNVKIGMEGTSSFQFKYFGRVESSIGNYPVSDGDVENCITNPQVGHSYTWDVVLGAK